MWRCFWTSGPNLIARRKVAVIRSDESLSHHITHAEAHSQVGNQKAEWIDDRFKAIRLFDARVIAKGKPEFAWQARFSGSRERNDGPAGQFRAACGVMVMQMESAA